MHRQPGLILIPTILALAACGGSGASSDGGGTSADAGLTKVVTSYASGQIETEGQVDAEGRRQGTWRLYHADGQRLFVGDFVDGQLDQSQAWTEWNADGSVRFDQSDGAHPSGGPW